MRYVNRPRYSDRRGCPRFDYYRITREEWEALAGEVVAVNADRAEVAEAMKTVMLGVGAHPRKMTGK